MLLDDYIALKRSNLEYAVMNRAWLECRRKNSDGLLISRQTEAFLKSIGVKCDVRESSPVTRAMASFLERLGRLLIVEYDKVIEAAVASGERVSSTCSVC